MNRGGRVEPTPPECALAAEMFDHFCSAGTMKQILALHREICNTLNLKPTRLPGFYPKLKAKLSSSWKAQALFKKFDARANHKVYGKGRACVQGRVLIIGAGPCGLRAAIECQLLGNKVVVIEKRDRMSRNNVLHLWPFVIQDLRALGAKKFFGKFCAGSIDHISIRQLQCILLKVALLLGVEFHEGVSFEELLEPTITDNSETLGWRARVTPTEHPVAQYEFDVLVGADGKRNTLQGFKRKEFRGKLAMAITANFINRHTEQEASVEEISGVAFIFNQKFFKELYEETGIDLENIVYYKDDTHYFVMTAKKHSLLDKGVLLNDYTEVSRLLSVVNVDRDALMRYAQEAARFSTDGKLPLRDFALNHYGEPDVALFDFTSMYAAENASMVYERHGRRLLCQLVGDSLLEPFWPTGSGCARGFLSAFDAAWAVRAWGQAPHPHPLEVIAERESVYRLLAQTTPENLHRDFGAYTIDPGTRYPNLNRAAVTPHRVTGFYNSDDPLPLDAAPAARKRRRAEAELSDEAILGWVGWSEPGLRAAASPSALGAVLLRYRPDLLCPGQSPRPVHHILHHEFGIAPFSSNGSTQDVPDAKLRSYLARVYTAFKGEVPHVHHQSDVFHQIKQQQKENAPDLSIARYTSAAEAEKTPSNNKKKRRSVRTPHVSNANDPAEYIRKQIGKLDLNDITQLARLIEGHDAIKNDEEHADQQKELQEQILALLDPEDSPDPNMLRSSLSQLLHGSSKTKMKTRERESNLARYFQDGNGEQKVTKPPRRLKGLDADSVKVPDFDIFNDSADTDVTVVNMETKKKDLGKSSPRDTHKKKEFIRSASTESSLPPKGRRMSEITRDLRNRQSESPEVTIVKTRSNSIGAPELVQNTRRIAQLFEGHKRRHTPSPQSRATRSNSAGSVTIPEKVLRWQRMAEIIEGKQRNTPSPERVKRESIGNPEMALRRQKVADLIQGHKPRQSQSPEPVQKKNASEMAFRMQRVSDMMQKRREEAKRPKSGGRRKAAREIMRQRFEKSLQMLAAEPSLEMAPSADLENDYGLQQYRASAPQFEDRVKKLEKKLQHYEEGRIVGGGGRTAGSGARVARLAAELSGTTNTPAAVPKASKPKDLMRSVGKIERDDWNVKEIERKIMENRLGRPEPKTAEKVPKWDREQFLGRQKRLKEGEASDEKWVEIDETLHKLDQKLRDSGRPDHGTRKVANLANKFVKKDEPVPAKTQPKEEIKKGWRGPSSAGMQCAACGTRVFAAEGVTADGLHLHRACFRCAVCKAVLRPGNYTMERYGSRLVCMRHSGTTVPDAATIIASLTAPAQTRAPTTTPERISLEVSDSCAREIDEDEWTDRNFLASETSGAGGLSDDDDSSSDEYTDAGDSVEEEAHSPDLPVPRLHRADVYASDDSFGYDEYSDDGAESSGNESCSRMREAREARRREVPAEARPPTDSSEVESDDESDSSEVSSATEVSTDSEFAKEENAAAPLPPAILVTEATPPAPPPPQDYPLSRTRSAGGLATKRALELKRRYLLGEPSPPAVRKSDSTSQLDTKLEAFRSTITEFQKMLHPAPAPVTSTPLQRPLVAVQFSTEEKRSQPMPDIIQNLCDAPVDLLTKGDSPLCKREWIDGSSEDRKDDKTELETDSLSDDSSHTETAPNQPVPRVEVHDEGGELIQLDSLTIINSTTEENDDKASGTATATGPTVVAAESESSESCRDATTLALTETELSDWAAESAVLDECGLDDRDERKRSKNPRTLSGPKTVHDTKNITAIPSHVCGRTSPTDRVVYSNALEHFEFADEGDQDPSVETPLTPRNEGYMELVNDDYDPYSLGHDRSINFIEGSFETVVKPSQEASISQILEGKVTTNDLKNASEIERSQEEPKSNSEAISDELKSPQLLKSLENISSDKSNSDDTATSDAVIVQLDDTNDKNDPYAKGDLLSLSDTSRSVGENTTEHKSKKDDSQIIKSQDSTSKSNSSNGSLLSTRSSSFKNDVSIEDASPPLVSEPTKSKSKAVNNMNVAICPKHCSIRLYSPAICRSASDTFNRSNSRSTNSPARSMELSINFSSGSGSISSVSMTMKDMTDKVQEIKREREEQTEVVRRLVLERLGNAPKVSRKSTRRMRVSPVGTVPPPVPPPPVSLTPPLPPPPLEEVLPPPRPAPPLVLPVTPSFSDPELARDRRRRSIMKSISNYLNRRLGPRQKESPASMNKSPEAHKSTGALQEAPPVPPPPAGYSLPDHHRQNKPAEQQAATVAELVQVTAQRDARRALLAAERRRSGVGN